MAASLDGLLGQSLGLPALWQINIVVVQIELESENELRVAQLCLHGPVADEKIQLRCHRKHGAGVLRVMAVFLSLPLCTRPFLPFHVFHRPRCPWARHQPSRPRGDYARTCVKDHQLSVDETASVIVDVIQIMSMMLVASWEV